MASPNEPAPPASAVTPPAGVVSAVPPQNPQNPQQLPPDQLTPQQQLYGQRVASEYATRMPIPPSDNDAYGRNHPEAFPGPPANLR